MSPRKQSKKARFASKAKGWRRSWRAICVGIDMGAPGGDRSATVYRMPKGGYVMLLHPVVTLEDLA